MVKKTNFTFIIIALCILLITTLSVVDHFSSSFSDTSAKKLPSNQDFEKHKGVNFNFVTTIDNKKFSLSQFKGKIIIVNFWATWCKPCLTEFPIMIEILKKFPKKVILVAISNQEKKIINKFFYDRFKKWGISKLENMFIVSDEELAIKKFNVMVVPETFIYDKNFEIIHKVVGASQWQSGEVLKLIGDLVQKKAFTQ